MNYISPLRFFSVLIERRALVLQLAQRESFAKYKNSIFGVLWSFVTPLCLLAVYTFVFSEVFQAKWAGGGSGSKTEFAVVLFAGLSVFNFFAECISKSTTLILSNQNYVKKLVFPLELLSVVVVLSALVSFMISISILLLFKFLALGDFHFSSLVFPFVILPLIVSVLGMVWFFSSLGVYVRDVSQTVGVVLTGLMFMSPIFFPVDALPEKWQFLMRLNPIALPIDQTRDLLVFGRLPDFGVWLSALGVGVLIFMAGFAWFQLTRKGFADVL